METITPPPLAALRQLRVGEEIRATDLIHVLYGGFEAVKDVRGGMVGKKVLGPLNYIEAPADEVYRPRERAPKGYSVKDWQTEWHAYRGGVCIAQCLSRQAAITACWQDFQPSR